MTGVMQPQSTVMFGVASIRHGICSHNPHVGVQGRCFYLWWLNYLTMPSTRARKHCKCKTMCPLSYTACWVPL